MRKLAVQQREFAESETELSYLFIAFFSQINTYNQSWEMFQDQSYERIRI